MSFFRGFGSTQSTTTGATTAQPGSSLLGSTTQQQQQQPAGGSLFGAQGQSSTQTPSFFGTPSGGATSTGGGLFGGQSTGTTTGGSLFGGQQQQQPQQMGGGLFGTSTQQQQQPSAGGGLFGSTTTTQQPAAGGGLFGSTATQLQQQQPGTNLFGSTAQQPQTTTGGGLFGTSTTQPTTTGGGLFGTAAQQTQPATWTTTGTQQTQPGTTTGGLFGSTQPSTTGGGLFGTTQPSTTGGGLFGTSTTQQQPQQAGGGLFGSTAATQPSGGGLFGSKPGGLFGTTSTTATTTTPSLFGGQAVQQQQPSAAGSLFAAPAQAQQQRPGLFGTLGQTTTAPLFGSAAGTTLGTSALGTSALGGAAQQQADAQIQHARLAQRIEAIYNAWNPASPQCRFQHNFYNLVERSRVSLYRQPPNVSNELWEKAKRENPDPACLVPVIATGFDDLRERVEAQSKQAEEHKKLAKDLKARLDALSERHTLSNSSRLQRAATQQIKLMHRLMALIQHLHLLIPAIRSSSIRPEEEQLRAKLEDIEEDVRRGRLRNKLNELWAVIGSINASKDRDRGTATTGGEWAVVDEEGLGQITQILAEQQAGLAHLTKILQKDLKDLSVIMGNAAVATNSSSDDSFSSEGDNLWTSTRTLRESTLR